MINFNIIELEDEIIIAIHENFIDKEGFKDKWDKILSDLTLELPNIRKNIITIDFDGNMLIIYPNENNTYDECINIINTNKYVLNNINTFIKNLGNDNCIINLYFRNIDLSDLYRYPNFLSDINIKKLDLSNCNLNQECLGIIHSYLSKLDKIKLLDLSRNPHPVMEYYIRKIVKDCNIENLVLSSNNINSKCVEEIVIANLERNTTLKTLYLNDNKLGELGGQYIEKLLRYNKNITLVQIDNCNIPEDTKNRLIKCFGNRIMI